MAHAAAATLDDANKFLNRAMLTLIVVAATGFAVVSLSGAINVQELPLITHAHALVMGVWLVLIAVQSHLGSRGNITLHKRLGQIGVALAILVVVTGLLTAINVVSTGRVPTVFSPVYFLVLGIVNIASFALFIVAALIMRKNTAWHRRLMFGALIMIFEPALGRILPIIFVPFLGGPDNAFALIEEHRGIAEIVRMFAHLFIVLVVMLGDRVATGRFHPVYAYLFAAVISVYALVNGAASLPFISDFADSLVVAEIPAMGMVT